MTRADAIAIREARRARVSMIRRRVVAGALALFVATWLLITIMLVTGHDPALARQRSAVTQPTSSSSSSGVSPATSSSSSGSSDTSSSSSGATSSSTGGSSSVGVSPVTSSQS